MAPVPGRPSGRPFPFVLVFLVPVVRRVAVAAIAALTLLAGVARAQGTLSGTVIDADGRPVPRAEVVVSGAVAAPLVTRTDDEGRFALPVTHWRAD